MRCKIEYIRLAPNGEQIVVETVILKTATVRQVEAKAHTRFDEILQGRADGFRVVEYHVAEKCFDGCAEMFNHPELHTSRLLRSACSASLS